MSSVKIQRVGDPNSANAPITSTLQSTVFANGILVAVNGSPIAHHGKGIHSSATTDNGSGTVFINNTPVNRLGDTDTCQHIQISGSPNVFIG